MIPIGGYSLNPGQASTFPWLSQIAGQFTAYECHYGAFQFVSTYGTAIGGPGAVTSGTSTLVSPANAALGSVSMAIQYDTVLPAWVDKQSMLSDTGAVSGRPSENMVCQWNVRESTLPLRKLYVRTGEPAANTDLRMYDFGTLYVSSDGMQIPFNVVDSVPIRQPIKVGELWVDYSFTFYKPFTAPVAPEPTQPTPLSIVAQVDLQYCGWGGGPTGAGAFGPKSSQTVLYPVLEGGGPNTELIAAFNMPTVSNNTITLPAEPGTTIATSRAYRIDIQYTFNASMQIGTQVAWNYNPVPVPPPGDTFDTTHPQVSPWIGDNVQFEMLAPNNAYLKDNGDQSAITYSSWSLSVIVWLNNPELPGTLTAQTDLVNGQWLYAPQYNLTYPGETHAAALADVIMTIGLISNEQAALSGKGVLQSTFKNTLSR